MNIERIKMLLKQTEGLHLEFKEAKTEVPDNLYETICAMLNRDGGDILLGVNDDGIVTGILQNALPRMMQNIISTTNTRAKLDPPFLLNPSSCEIDGEHILHLQVPASSQIHRTNLGVYDRGNEGDFLVKEPYLIAEMYNRKRSYYTESKIYPKATMNELKGNLFHYSRNLIKSNVPNHPWLALDDNDLLRISGLFRKDMQTGEEGLTLAALLLFGKDEVIQSILPHYKTDLLVRRIDLERYDDREYVTTNLIEAYDLAMAFIAKHLPDKPYYEDEQRISLRTHIFREVISNLLIHREFTNATPARLIIYKDRIETENANNPHGTGLIQLSNYTPFPKNPLIAKFFIQMGRAEELGSGILNVNKYLPIYAPGAKPEFIEGINFKSIIPIMEPGPYEIWNLGKSEGDTQKSEGNTSKSEGDTQKSEGIVSLIDSMLKVKNKTTRQQCHDLVFTILTSEGMNLEHYKSQLNFSQSSIERYIKRLKAALIIEIEGKARASVYKITQDFKDKMQKEKKYH